MFTSVKKIIVILFLLANTFFAQWSNEGAWPSESFIGGTHGITVDPDGKVWTSTYYKHDTWITPVDSVSIATSAIYVINSDGTQAEFSPIYFVTTSNGTVTDTLNGNCRGLTTDENGNILYVQSAPNKLFKIDYKTGEGIAKRNLGDELGSSPTKPSVSDDGTIFIGPVVGNGSSAAAITMYTADLELFGKAVVGPPGVGRTMEISKDGNTLYWMPFDLQQMYVYTRESVLSDFALTDSLLKGMSIESSAWNPATGNLWVSNDVRGLAHHTHLTWFAVDVTTKALVDSFTWQPNDNEGELARAIDFSPDGTIAYAGTFEVSTAKIQKFINGEVSVEKLTGVLPTQFELNQNYPNPFNPTTTISFEMPKDGMVRLEIYDILGREVKSLINEYKQAGSYKITFDAAELTSGTYIYTLRAGRYQESKKMTVLK
jgi:hypothetical protein